MTTTATPPIQGRELRAENLPDDDPRYYQYERYRGSAGEAIHF